ncbi:SBBP repeat-containing protein [Acidobacteria bacterium AH-259-O06]|nr:SBBP repeat-containing protein [Acidobacteria bacterium AH-259-O06]
MAVDATGNVYVTGRTNSEDFPTKNPLQDTKRSTGDDVFVAKLNPAASGAGSLAYSGENPLTGTRKPYSK